MVLQEISLNIKADDNIAYERAFGQELSSENSQLQMNEVLACDDDFSSIENESSFAAAQ